MLTSVTIGCPHAAWLSYRAPLLRLFRCFVHRSNSCPIVNGCGFGTPGNDDVLPDLAAQNQDSPSFNGAFGRPRLRNACRHYSHFCPSRGSWLFFVRISQKGDPRGPHSQPKCVSRTCRSRSVERPLSSAWPTQVSMLLLLGHLGTTSFGAPSCRSAPVHAFASPDQPSRNVYAQASTPSLFATNARHREHVSPVCTQAQMTLLHS
jgi:hypothetical protein